MMNGAKKIIGIRAYTFYDHSDLLTGQAGMQSPPKTIGIKKSLLLMSKRCIFSQRKHLLCRKRRAKEKLIKRKMEKVKDEMEEISKQQQSIRNGQREVKQKSEMIEFECQKLRKQTDFIARQALNTQLRLCLMFQILKARENNNFTKAAALTHILREVIAK